MAQGGTGRHGSLAGQGGQLRKEEKGVVDTEMEEGRQCQFSKDGPDICFHIMFGRKKKNPGQSSEGAVRRQQAAPQSMRLLFLHGPRRLKG